MNSYRDPTPDDEYLFTRKMLARLKTGDDAMSFFAQHGSKTALKMVHLNRAPQGRRFRPYDVVVVAPSQIDPEHFTMSGIKWFGYCIFGFFLCFHSFTNICDSDWSCMHFSWWAIWLRSTGRVDENNYDFQRSLVLKILQELFSVQSTSGVEIKRALWSLS